MTRREDKARRARKRKPQLPALRGSKALATNVERSISISFSAGDRMVNAAPELPNKVVIPEFGKKETGDQWACMARLGGVGDNLICSSVLPGLKAKYGKVEVICAQPQHVVFENNPYIDKLTVKAQGDPKWGTGLEWQEWFRSRAKEYAFFAHLSHTCEGLRAILPNMTAFQWPASARRKFFGQSYLETVHDVCELPYDCIAPNFFPTDEEVERALLVKSKVGEQCVGWVLSGTRIDKVYPWAPMCIAQIIRELDMPVIMFGAPGKDFEMAKQIQEHVKQQNGSDRGLHLALSESLESPHWPIRRILTQVQQCDLVVTPDTGPAWAVAMRDMPKIVTLSHASPTNITKYWRNTISLHADQSRVKCWPCHQLHDVPDTCTPNKENNGAACISDISIPLVMTALKAMTGSIFDLEKTLGEFRENVTLWEDWRTLKPIAR